MKRIRTRLSLVLALALAWCLAGPLPALADDLIICSVTGGYLFFDSSSGTVVRCDETVTEADVPRTIGGVPVVAIADQVFQNHQSLTAVKLPEGLLSIGAQAFAGCGALRQVSIPGSVQSIGDRAFYGCWRLGNVSLPAGLGYMGNEAFRDCASMTAVTVPGNLLFVPDGAFSGCTRLQSAVLADGIVTLSNEVFSGCAFLSSVSFPAGFLTVGYNAFSGCPRLHDVLFAGDAAAWDAVFIAPGNEDLTRNLVLFEGRDVPYVNPDRPYVPAPEMPAPDAEITALFNGKPIFWEGPHHPYINSDGQTMVPLRQAAEAMGLHVTWDSFEQTISITDGIKTIIYPVVGATEWDSAGSPLLDNPFAVILGGTGYGQVRYLAEFFGRTVRWDDASRSVVIE